MYMSFATAVVILAILNLPNPYLRNTTAFIDSSRWWLITVYIQYTCVRTAYNIFVHHYYKQVWCTDAIKLYENRQDAIEAANTTILGVTVFNNILVLHSHYILLTAQLDARHLFAQYHTRKAFAKMIQGHVSYTERCWRLVVGSRSN